MRRAGEVLDRWGYRSALSARHSRRGVFSQVLLLNRSPRLDDLDTAAFARRRAHPATDGHQGSMLYALQRVVAALGHCDPPVRMGHNHAPIIEGADAAWTAWIERWYADLDTDPQGARHHPHQHGQGRAVAGGRAPRDHRTEPVDQTDLRGLGRRRGPDERRRLRAASRRPRRTASDAPISPRTKAHVLTCSRTFFRDCQEWEWFGRRFDPTRALAVPRSRRRADRHRPAGHRRRRVGEAAVGRAGPCEPDDLPARHRRAPTTRCR